MNTKNETAGSAVPRQKILVVDDHPLVRAGLMQLINREPGLAVMAEAGSPREAMAELARTKPDLIVVDITMKDGGGLEFIKDVRAVHGEIPMLVVSMHDEMVYAERALRAGASGYIMKEESAVHLITAIQRVLGGGVYLSEAMSGRLLRSVSNPKTRNTDSPLQTLTDRELEVFQLIGQGHTTEEIARRLSLSPKTVDVHRAHIKEKLQLKSGTALIHQAVQWFQSQTTSE